jgi:hypothetical protein
MPSRISIFAFFKTPVILPRKLKLGHQVSLSLVPYPDHYHYRFDKLQCTVTVDMPWTNRYGYHTHTKYNLVPTVLDNEYNNSYRGSFINIIDMIIDNDTNKVTFMEIIDKGYTSYRISNEERYGMKLLDIPAEVTLDIVETNESKVFADKVRLNNVVHTRLELID